MEAQLQFAAAGDREPRGSRPTSAPSIQLHWRVAHMRAAYVYAAMAKPDKRKVGCVIAAGEHILSYGINGTPKGESNLCEAVEADGHILTLPNAIHADRNALRKLGERGLDCHGATAFITYQPCLDCASRLRQAGIVEVYYSEPSRHPEGVEHLRAHGIRCELLELDA